ncbi:sigma-54 dependent transcriptional regulator [Geomonas nitrogeniifigens]|uniref:Sigma-54 dependent transcriptional regulator n=1 Tax=Geomonas diazotrophica TaxID=2843197 RepID=A0ABX8JKY3_9BACT|nr:sigma-54 dependent transcriptional regulator [Geomonas nitrogeniifigens]QWV98413.1 sigma-54 dependent transcriptional regulator [Geomonas nitrogeniifigens]
MKKTLFPAFGILLVDDEPAWLKSFALTLKSCAGINNIVTCQESREVMGLLDQGGVGLVLLDLTMPQPCGETLLQQIGESHPGIMTIIVSGMNQLETAVRCMKLGAFDYIVKTDEEDRLVSGVLRAVRILELQQEFRTMSDRMLSRELKHPEAFVDIVTCDPRMHDLFNYVEAVSPSHQPLLITGESGVGKELVARAVHTLSGCSGPLVAVNVAGLDDTVFADTLFGHVRGAYTGADQARPGMIEQAGNGTLFLDEIGDLSIASQVKLLRLLQEGEYFPLGGDRPKRMNARIVVATHRDLAAREAAGEFRRDLYYRLCTHRISIPPLRERVGDIPLLLDYFLNEAAKSLGKKKPTPPKELAQVLATYSFPGNVRELRGMVYNAVSLHKDRILSMESFLKAIGQSRDTANPPLQSQNPFATFERLPTFVEAAELLVEEAISRSNGVQAIAARLLGISAPALNKRLKMSRK